MAGPPSVGWRAVATGLHVFPVETAKKQGQSTLMIVLPVQFAHSEGGAEGMKNNEAAQVSSVDGVSRRV